MTTEQNSPGTGFAELALSDSVHKALLDIGYAAPTPIQALTIPHLLQGRDVIGQAQTGTGKTAAFALPLLSKLDTTCQQVQVLVLAPTRELAIQDADGFSRYGSHLKKLRVLPIYGGQDYGVQLRALRRGVNVVIGTPGRVMDHMRRGTLSLQNLSCLVLDEADEMLRMGFIDDVEWILEQTPSERQTVLFSATMPKPIRQIAKRHLRDPKDVIIEKRTTAAESIRQRYLVVPGFRKLEALERILEQEDYQAVLVFAKTRAGTAEVAEKLSAAGHSACALNGDLSQAMRERTLNQFKRGKFHIVVATDVAARGLDVERISHVINYDAPFDPETYVHRIGRTGRAGRSGEAVLFLTPNEKSILRNLSRATKQDIAAMEYPSAKAINSRRLQKLNDQIAATLQSKDTAFFKGIIETYCAENGADQLDVAAALAQLLQGDTPMLLPEETRAERNKKANAFDMRRTDKYSKNRTDRYPKDRKPQKFDRHDQNMERYRIEVGSVHGVEPANIVGAITNEIGINRSFIGRIEIFQDHSTVDLVQGMSAQTMGLLKKVWVCQNQLNISKEGAKKAFGKSTGGKPLKQRAKKLKRSKKKAKKKQRLAAA